MQLLASGHPVRSYLGRLRGIRRVHPSFSTLTTYLANQVTEDQQSATPSSSIGTVLPEQKVRDLPLGTRNVLDLLTTNAGVSNAISGTSSNDGASAGDTGYFAGGRLSAVNVTRDDFTVSDQRYNHGAFSVTYTSPDLVEELRVITAPVDSEVNRIHILFECR